MSNIMTRIKRMILNKTALSLFISAGIMIVLILVSSMPALAVFDNTSLGNPKLGTNYQYGYGGGGAGEGVGFLGWSTFLGTTNIMGLVTNEGRFTSQVTAISDDGLCNVYIPKDTVGLDKDLKPITQITVKKMETAPTPPTDGHIIGLAYDFGPEGASFDPPVTITFSYNRNNIPAGVDEKDLVIAFYDKSTGQWVTLSDIVVDPITHTISGKISHFTAFAVVVIPPAPTTPVPTTPAPTTPEPTTPAPTTPAVTTPAVTTPAVTTPPATTPAATTPAATTPAATTPAPTTPVSLPTQTNWSLIGGIIAAVIVIIALCIYFFWWRRRFA